MEKPRSCRVLLCHPGENCRPAGERDLERLPGWQKSKNHCRRTKGGTKWKHPVSSRAEGSIEVGPVIRPGHRLRCTGQGNSVRGEGRPQDVRGDYGWKASRATLRPLKQSPGGACGGRPSD